jgi:nicotinamidase-related amidase
MEMRKTDTAVVFIDPQNDVLSEKGANWGAVGASVTENKTIENMERIFKAAKVRGYEVFISPHYFYPTDSGWKTNGPLEADEFRTRTFARTGPSGASVRSSSAGCWPTCVSSPICASLSSKALRSQLSKMQRPDRGTRCGATAIKRRSSTIDFSPMQ